MCGIFGCISQQPQNLIQKTLQGLKVLEYRGYDSAGIAYQDTSQKMPTIKTIKSVGEISNLRQKIKKQPSTTVCIGHTRWATNGAVNLQNSHPHLSFNKEIAVVHNGIIENYQACCTQLQSHQINLKTPVDTEVIPNILYLLQQNKHNIHDFLQGQYVFCAIENNHKSLFIAKKGNLPLYIGRDQQTTYVTSDTLALPSTVTQIITLENLETCEITSSSLTFYKQAKIIKKDWQTFHQSFIPSDKNGFATYMEKEIHEIPDIMQRIITSYSYNKIIKNLKRQFQKLIKNIDCIHLCGCGTSYHAALILSQVFEKELRIRSIPHVSSELSSDTLLPEKAIAIVISQSGETADTLACMDTLSKHQIPIVALCNVTTSTIAQRSQINFPLLCGPEIAVASTKVFCAALLVGHLIIKKLPVADYTKFINETQQILKDARQILPLPQDIPDKIFIIGKNLNYGLALEAALKIKEVTYLHCEGYPAHELKHGPLAMVNQKTLAIAIGKNTENAAAEIQARGGKIIHIPNSDNPLSFIYQIIPAQILALDLAQKLGINPDKPRNLAKSVTVL